MVSVLVKTLQLTLPGQLTSFLTTSNMMQVGQILLVNQCQTDSLVYGPGSSSRDLVWTHSRDLFGAENVTSNWGINPGHFEESGCMFVFDDFNLFYLTSALEIYSNYPFHSSRVTSNIEYNLFINNSFIKPFLN